MSTACAQAATPVSSRLISRSRQPQVLRSRGTSLFGEKEIVVGNIGDAHDKHSHAALRSVDDAGRDVNQRALADYLLDAIEHDTPFSLQDVV